MQVNNNIIMDPALLRMRNGDVLKVKLPDVAELPSTNGGKTDESSKSDDLLDTFADELGKAVSGVNNRQIEAKDISEAFATGKKEGIHETMIALEEADISLRFLGSVRNKMLESYKEVMRINV